MVLLGNDPVIDRNPNVNISLGARIAKISNRISSNKKILNTLIVE